MNAEIFCRFFLLQWYDDAPIIFQVGENYFSCLIVVPNVIFIQLFDVDFVNNFLHHALDADVINHLLCPKLDISNVVMPFNRIQGKYMLENKKLSDRKIIYQFLGRIPIQNRTIAQVIVNRESNEKEVFKVGDNIVIDVTTPALNTSQREMPMLGIERRSAR